MPHDATGNYVSQTDAFTMWAPVARDALVTTARRYRGLITYKELAAQVQDVSGATTTQRLDYWIGGLLEKVAGMCVTDGEPPLTSLCVHQDGTIGPGYARAPRSTDDDPHMDVDDLAAFHRLLCYRAYAADLPADGGVAALTPQVAAARARRRRSGPEVARPKCPTHFMELSATGVCALCE